MLSFHAVAQVPGYMGRRLTLGYSLNCFPSLLGPATYGSSGLNATHGFNLEYIAGKKTNVCASFQLLKTGVYETGGYALENGEAEVLLQLPSKNITAGLKFFSKSAQFSPIGKYNKFELMVMFSDLAYKGKTLYSYKDFALLFTMGRQRVVFNRLVLDGGLQFGFLPAGYLGGLFNSVEPGYEYHYAVRERLFRHQLFNLHLGVSFLTL